MATVHYQKVYMSGYSGYRVGEVLSYGSGGYSLILKVDEHGIYTDVMELRLSKYKFIRNIQIKILKKLIIF